MDSTSTAGPGATSTSEVPVTSPSAVVSLDGLSFSPADLIDAPLPQLLAECDAEIYDSSITDAGFFGCAIQRKDGHIALAMPPAREAFERDTIARILLGKVLGIPMAPLPRSLRMGVTA